MRPEDQTHSGSSQPSRDVPVPERDAAINVVRGQLDALYTDQASTPKQPAAQPIAPAQAQPQQQVTAPHSEQWKQYHSAWMDYYQKYYQRYYTSQMHRVLSEQQANRQPDSEPTAVEPETPKNKEEALFALRQKLAKNVEQSAKKVRGSRHFVPVAAALCVVILFAFLQYNSILFGTVQAYISPGAIDPQNIIVDPSTDVAVSGESRLIIPKINVDVPMVYGAKNDHDSMMAAMQKGIAHFAIPGASSVPGQKGNTVFSGHSSNDLFESGDYKFIFAQLNSLSIGDPFYVNYQGKRYMYRVSSKEIVSPTNVAVLLGTNDKPIITLITCWPIGTANQRVILKADQVTPDPAAAAASPSEDSTSSGDMPGNGETVLDRLFGN